MPSCSILSEAAGIEPRTIIGSTAVFVTHLMVLINTIFESWRALSAWRMSDLATHLSLATNIYLASISLWPHIFFLATHVSTWLPFLCRQTCISLATFSLETPISIFVYHFSTATHLSLATSPSIWLPFFHLSFSRLSLYLASLFYTHTSFSQPSLYLASISL